MVNLKFEVNDKFLASYLVAKAGTVKYATKDEKQLILNFKDKAWDISQNTYNLISGPLYIPLINIKDNDIKNIGNNINDYLNDLIRLDEFKVLREETLASVNLCKNNWNKNYETMEKYITEIGINISGEFTIWLVHPTVAAGMYMRNNNICWSHQTYWPNYNTVYLWHEILHSFFGRTDYEHTLIELITDDHMRYLLNGTKYPPFEGHDRLADFKKEALPIWKKYLESEDKNIKSLVAEFKSAYEVFSEKQN